MTIPQPQPANPVPGNMLSDIILWVRRIVKTPSDQSLPDGVIADYVNRFYTYDAPARLQLFELKRQYTFESLPNTFIYQFPFDLFQTISQPAYCDGVQMGFYGSTDQFYKVFPEFVNNEQPTLGNGGTNYNITFAQSPVLRGFIDDLGNLQSYVYITSTDANGVTQILQDDGAGNLVQIDENQNIIVDPITGVPINRGTVNYIAGTAVAKFPNPIAAGVQIFCQSDPYSAGFPRVMLFFNNTIKLYPVPDRCYKIQVDAYITPAQFLATNESVTFNYMAEWLARGAARKILSDNADYDQFQFYEPFFQEQEVQVLRRTERQNTAYRAPTIFSSQTTGNPNIFTQY